MTWYYALGNERQGPVEDAELDRLIASGIVTSDTLVWRAGMADWQPLSQARPRVAPPPPAPVPPSPEADATRMIPAAGTPASPATPASDPATRPRFQPPAYGTPGATAGGAAAGAGAAMPGASTLGATPSESPEALYARASSRSFQIGDVISRGWGKVMENALLAIGGTFVALLLTQLAGMIPCIGIFVSLAVQAPLMGGLWVLFLKLERGQTAEFGDIFAGFSIAYLPLVLQGVVQLVLLLLAAVPGGLILFVGAALSERSEALGGMVMLVGGLVAFVPMLYLGLSWIFSLGLIVDKRLDFWPAMELSRKVVTPQFLTVFGLALACVGIVLLGVLALCVGVLVAAPVCYAALAAAYEDLFA